MLWQSLRRTAGPGSCESRLRRAHLGVADGKAGLLAGKGEAHLTEINADAFVAARVASVGLAGPHTLPPVHKDLDYRLGFLRSKVLAQERK
jgi:hypothetical protein